MPIEALQSFTHENLVKIIINSKLDLPASSKSPQNCVTPNFILNRSVTPQAILAFISTALLPFKAPLRLNLVCKKLSHDKAWLLLCYFQDQRVEWKLMEVFCGMFDKEI